MALILLMMFLEAKPALSHPGSGIGGSCTPSAIPAQSTFLRLFLAVVTRVLASSRRFRHPPHRMRCFLQLRHSLFRIAAVAAGLIICFVPSAWMGAADQKQSRSGDSLLGSFSTSDRYSEQNNISISISVRREDGSYRLGFQGMGRALHGHAPEGSGHGQINEGVFRFQFEDSFFNRGSGTFRKVGDHYLLHIDISEVAEPRIMSAYGDTPLYRDKT